MSTSSSCFVTVLSCSSHKRRECPGKAEGSEKTCLLGLTSGILPLFTTGASCPPLPHFPCFHFSSLSCVFTLLNFPFLLPCTFSLLRDYLLKTMLGKGPLDKMILCRWHGVGAEANMPFIHSPRNLDFSIRGRTESRRKKLQ